ncbi:hypothetical protein VL73_5 [Erwinia phage VL73]
MKAMLITGPKHGQVMDVINEINTIRLPLADSSSTATVNYSRDEPQMINMLFTTYRLIARDEGVAYFAPIYSSLGQVITELLK